MRKGGALKGLISASEESPSHHGRLLSRLLDTRRRTGSRQTNLRRVKADLARAAGWVAQSATDKVALQAFRGRGGRTRLVHELQIRCRSGPIGEEHREDTSEACLEVALEATAEWIDYLREYRIGSRSDLTALLKRDGIDEKWRELILGAFDQVRPHLFKAPSAYRRGRIRMARAVLAEIWGLSEGQDGVKKQLQRLRARLLTVNAAIWTKEANELVRRRAEPPSRS
jgi:hypothetical protein